MSDEKVIIDIEIDQSDALKNTKSLTVAIVEQTTAIKAQTDATKALEKENKDLEKTNKQLADEVKKGNKDKDEANKLIGVNNKVIEANNAKIKQNKVDLIGQKDALQKTKAERKSAIKTMETESNSLNALRLKNKELRKEQADVNLVTKEGQKRIKEINAEINKNDSAIKKNSDALSQQKQNIGNYKDALSGVPGPIGMIQKGLTAMVVNPIFAILAGAVFVIHQLREAFTRSAEGQDLLAKGMGILKGLLGVVEKLFGKLASAAIKAFTEPKKAVKELWEFIKSQIVNRIKGVADLFINLGKLITGGFSNIKENAKALSQSLIQVTTGLDVEQQAKTWEDLNGAMQGVNDTIGQGIKLEKERLGLRRSEIGAITQIAQLEADVAKARLTAADKMIAVEERLKAINVAEQKALELINVQVALAQKRLNIKRIENSLSKTGLDDLQEEKQFEADIIRLQAGKQRELRTFNKLRATTLDELADREIKTVQSTAKANSKTRTEELELLAAGFSKVLETAELTARKRVDIEKQRDDAINGIAAESQKKQAKLDERNTKAAEEQAELVSDFRERALLKSLEGTELFFTKKQELIDEDFDKAKEKLTADLEAGKITQEEQFAALLELQGEFNDATLELDDERRSQLREVDEEDFEGRKELELERFEESKELLEEQLKSKELTEAEHKQALEDLEAKHSENILNIQEAKLRKTEEQAKTSADKVSKIAQAALQIRANILEKAQRKESEKLSKQNREELDGLNAKLASGLLSQAQFDDQKTALDEKFKKQEADLAIKQEKQKYEIELKAFKLNKATALAQIAIDIAATVSKAILATPLTFGLPFSAINLGLQLAQAGAVASTSPPPPPSFAEGGEVRGMRISGKSHTAGGEDIHVGGKLIGNMQGDEGLFVTKKEATAEALSYINQSYGGRDFAGTNKNYFQEGGAAVPINSISPEALQAAMSEALKNLPQPIVQVEDMQAGLISREETLETLVV